MDILSACTVYVMWAELASAIVLSFVIEKQALK